MKPEELAKVSPNVRALVAWLNNNGFPTTDSGDGSNHAAGMEGACPFPLIAIQVEPTTLVWHAKRLRRLLEGRGVVFTADAFAKIEATFDPLDGVALILLIGVTSRDAGLQA